MKWKLLSEGSFHRSSEAGSCSNILTQNVRQMSPPPSQLLTSIVRAFRYAGCLQPPLRHPSWGLWDAVSIPVPASDRARAAYIPLPSTPSPRYADILLSPPRLSQPSEEAGRTIYRARGGLEPGSHPTAVGGKPNWGSGISPILPGLGRAAPSPRDFAKQITSVA